MYKNLRTYARGECAYVHTPTPEVDIMRNGNKSRQLLSLARLVVLALCFTMVFAAALATAEITTGNTVQIAEATVSDKGGAVPVDLGITADDFEYSPSTKSWICTKSLTGINLSAADGTGNVSVYKPKDNNMDMNITASGNSYTAKANDYTTKWIDVYTRVNFEIGEFARLMVAKGLFTVQVTIDADVSFDDCDNRSSGATIVTGYSKASSNRDGIAYGNPVTLTTDRPYVAFETYSSAQNQVGWPVNDRLVQSATFKSIKIEITRNSDSKSGPIVSSKYDEYLKGIASEYEKGKTGTGYAPYITDTHELANQAKFPVYYDSIKNRLKTDLVTNGSGNLRSYTSTALNGTLGNIPNNSNVKYYKYAQTEFVDTFNYTEETFDNLIVSAFTDSNFDTSLLEKAGIADKVLTKSDDSYVWTDATAEHYMKASGIKSVKVGNTEFSLYNSSGSPYGSETKEVFTTDTDGNESSIGYATVTRISFSRIIVSVYITTNCSIKTNVFNFDNQSTETNITVSGIDTTAPSDSNNSGTNIFLENYIGTNSSNVSVLNWFRQNTMTTDANFEINEDESAAGFSPYIWFYTVDRADTLAALKDKTATSFGNYAAVKSAGMLPVAVGELTSFTYDFARGAALTVDGKTYQGNPSDRDDAKGHGYYRFTFYMFDLAGNKGGEKSFFMKVDYDKPEYTLDFTYDKDGTTETIKASQNGKWATGDVTLKFAITNGGYSGFTFRFEDSSGAMYAFVINGKGEFTGDEYVPTLMNYVTAKTTTSVENNTHQITINGHTITVKYAVENGKGTLIFSIPKPAATDAFYEWVSDFSAFEGQYDSIKAIDNDDYALEYVDTDWKGGVKVLIDVEKPTNPIMSDEEGFVDKLTAYEIPQSRMWYTSSYQLDGTLEFTDAILSTDYAKGLKVHYGVRVVKSLADLQAIEAIGIETRYRTSTDPKTDFGFLQYKAVDGDSIESGGATDFPLDFLAAQSAGLRVLFIWAEDQAGNLSDVAKYYVFVDTNTYSVSAKVKDNANLESGFASISVTDGDGKTISSVKRGDTVKFNVSFENSYVPFALKQNGTTLLENYNKDRAWTKTATNSGLISFDSFDSEGASSITLTFDDDANLSDLYSNTSKSTAHAFELSARKVVTYSITNTKVAYTAEPTKVAAWMSFGYEKSKDSFKYDFVDKDGKVVATPTAVGDYLVRIYIPKDNDSFVTDDFKMDSDGKQTFTPIDYSIVRGKVVITAKDVSVVYGEKVPSSFDFDVEGIAKDKMAGEGISVELYINGTLNSHSVYDVGTYQILNRIDYAAQDIDNYEVTFESGKYSVSQRNVTVDAWGASKKYGDPDPEFKFGVKLSQLAGLYAEESVILAEIFEGYTQDTATTADGYAIYFAEGRISRKDGEGVSNYAFEADANLFDVNKNYTVRVQTSDYNFTIEKRTVKLDVSGQSSVFKFGTTVDDTLLATILPTYKISASDMVVASDIEELFENGLKIKLGTLLDDTAQSGYSATYKYAIVTDGTLTDGNIVIELDGDKGTDYIIYITEQNAIVIRVKDGVKFEFTYGYKWSADSIKYDVNKFAVESAGDIPTYDSVVWTTSIANDTLLDAGRYVVTFTGAKLYSGETELSDAVFVEPVSVTINPAKITLMPTASKTSKVYGEKDDVYGIDFAIATVGGQTIGIDGNYAGIAYADILAKINGAYVRAVYDKSGNKLSFANRYDDATDESNLIYGTDGRYYGFAVGTEFYSGNANFTVEANLDSSARFAIEQKAIDLNTKNFVGLSKTKDGNATVPYASKNVTMYDLSSLKVLPTDDVNLSATASYNSSDVGQRNITFENLKLDGGKAHNYKLAKITNDGKDTALNGKQGEFTENIDENTFVMIAWIDNVNGGEVIRILAGTIALLKSDVTISKQYDNTKDLTIDNIAISNGDTTGMLNFAKRVLIVDESTSFSGVNVSDNYSVSVAIFYEGMGDYVVNQEGIYNDSDIIFTPTEYNGTSGIKITIKNVKAEITKRVINKDSFTSLDAVDRDYNATKNVDMTYSFAQNALAVGDTAQTVGLQLKGLSEDKDVGTYSVTVDAASSKVFDSNYTIDADSINNAYKNKISVIISKARLVPNVTFKDRVYSGNTELVKVSGDSGDWTAKTNASGKGTFTSMQYADNLASELALFSYDLSAVSFTLSKDGKADANVQANGKHNVMVKGLEITFDGTDEQKKQAEKNFRLEGSVYSVKDKKYNEFVDLKIGAIADFEIIDALNMSKAQIQLRINDFVVNDKVYDGTTDVNVVISIADDRLVEQHKTLLEVVATGAFARKQVGDSIAIVLSAAKLQAKSTLSGDELAAANEAIANYELLQYKGTIPGNIKARPLLVNANLGTKEYNGDESAIKSTIKYTFTNMIAEDERYYAIQTRNNAYFDDRYVNVERDESGNPIVTNGQYTVIGKQGTAYNLRLTNIKEKYTNYTLVYSSINKLAGKTALAYVVDGAVCYDEPAEGTTVSEYWYALDTTKYYVAATDENRSTYKGHIVGFYKNNGADVLMLEKTYAEDNFASDDAIKSFGDTADEINYLRGEGKITQRSVYIRANGIERSETATAFEKYYDGTDKFFGQKGSDYQYSASAVANVIIGDDVTIAAVSAKFDSAYANAKYVVFTASGIAGEDAYNYTIEGTTVSTVNLEGKIKPRIINAHLADEVADYGIATGKYAGNVTYYLVGNDGKEYALVNEYANESAFYMTLADYLAAVGLESADATLFAENTYSLDNGKFVKAAEGAIGKYIRLGGTANDRISALPQAYVSFASTMPDAGSASVSYRFSTSGNAKNFQFSPVYTDDTNGTSKVDVVKKDLYVVTVSNGYTANYGQFMDKNGKLLVNVELLYLDKNGKDGIVSGQTQLTLFKKGTVNYYPVAQLGVYNSETGKVTAATAMSKTSDKLGANEYYVVYLVAPNDVNYNEAVKNYNIVLAGIDSISHKVVDGKVRTVFDMSEQGSSVKPETATLEIVLPKLTGVSVGSDTENTFTYTYSIDSEGKGINRLHDVVQGELSTDEVIFVDDNGSKLYPVNYKETPYSGTVYVRRYINADGSFVAFKDRDANGYYIEWNSGESKKEIKIEKADIGLRASNVSEYYNGKSHEYVNSNTRSSRISYNMLTEKHTLTDDDYEITYQVLNGKDYDNISQSDVVNAGKYRVTVKLTDKFLEKGIGSNYKQSTSIAEFQVLRAIVNVTISDEAIKDAGFVKSSEYVDGSTVLKLTGEYTEGKKYSFDYTVMMNSASNDPDIAIEKSDTKLVGFENIASAGKYSFAVVISDDYDANNYVFLTSTGVLELTTKNLATGGSSITINEGKGVVANRLEVKEVKTENALASDMSYLKAVEQYVAAMSKKAGVEGAKVAAVLRVNLYLDKTLVTLPESSTTITVELPQNVKNLDGIAVYYVNQNGGLTRLTDYTVEDGKLTYTADYINGLVFVDVNPEALEAWKIYVIIGSCVLFVLIVVATIVTYAVKKSKLKKIA